jgi:hypothetical protein
MKFQPSLEHPTSFGIFVIGKRNEIMKDANAKRTQWEHWIVHGIAGQEAHLILTK